MTLPTRHHDKYVIPPCKGPVLGTLNDSSSLKNKGKNLSALTASLHAAGTQIDVVFGPWPMHITR